MAGSFIVRGRNLRLLAQCLVQERAAEERINERKGDAARKWVRAKWLWLKECCCSVVIGFVIILKGDIAQHWTSMFIHGKRFLYPARHSWPLRCEELGSDESKCVFVFLFLKSPLSIRPDLTPAKRIASLM